MNPLATELNQIISDNSPTVFRLLSTFGKEIYFPKGILSQSQEAKEKATAFNATLGTATENGKPMFLPSIQHHINDLSLNDVYPYAPAGGKPELRDRWKEKLFEDNPSLSQKAISRPVVTCGITHGLALAADLFVNPEDTIILPDQFWGNYRLIFEVRYKAKISTYSFFNSSGGFNLESFKSHLQQKAKETQKLIIILNLPNNPTGYTVSPDEAQEIKTIIHDQAESGNDILILCDDAYFKLFYEDSIKESLFGYFTGLHKNVLCVKLDGATKEDYVWGFRVSFLSFGLGDLSKADQVYPALEKKVMGAIRSVVSNAPHLSQTLVLKALTSPLFQAEAKSKFDILKGRALRVREVLNKPKYSSAWDVYPFNSGYFMCLRLKSVDAEKLRLHLLDHYALGVISTNSTDIRIAFSCVEEGDIEKLFDLIYQGVEDLS
ncbi:MAG: aminotransferase class I/II-fold pyridoxal phosphate-dependent enzyme [Spirochaetota bacterium]|nr:aminotransferase class I/II-fold pyridoxal phosphate-dependent enzyme [Spirochaetota bacterium]